MSWLNKNFNKIVSILLVLDFIPLAITLFLMFVEGLHINTTINNLNVETLLVLVIIFLVNYPILLIVSTVGVLLGSSFFYSNRNFLSPKRKIVLSALIILFILFYLLYTKLGSQGGMSLQH